MFPFQGQSYYQPNIDPGQHSKGYTTRTISLVGGRKPTRRPPPPDDASISDESYGSLVESDEVGGEGGGNERSERGGAPVQPTYNTHSTPTFPPSPPTQSTHGNDQYLSRPDTPPKKRVSFGKVAYLEESGFKNIGNDQASSARIQRKREQGKGDWRAQGAIDY